MICPAKKEEYLSNAERSLAKENYYEIEDYWSQGPQKGAFYSDPSLVCEGGRHYPRPHDYLEVELLKRSCECTREESQTSKYHTSD